jgi:hypothetical protein
MKAERKHDHCDHVIAEAIYCLIREIKHIFGCKPKGRLELSFGLATLKTETGEHMPVAIKITNEQKINVTLSPKTDTGKPAKLDGAPVWSVIAGDSTVVAAPDGLSADLVSSDTPGDTTYLIDADADLGEGKEDLQETITLTVTGANAKNLGVTIGQAVPK